MFQILANPATNKVNFERFSRLGFVIGISEEELLLSLKEFNINKVTMQIDVDVRTQHNFQDVHFSHPQFHFPNSKFQIPNSNILIVCLGVYNLLFFNLE
jgi:hypothetical protein